ncbi:hypothetical protein [Gynuella sunshinyii]|uniref:7(1) septoil knot domain-containing protein n=1 Tax=Gynuella sunshinyii YC6258 TaxID=1445510 RepID=A0A0C5VTH2_9GAMM|nr:hypothetical protein [Gynuella sunshinyii]AJQ97486.1 hypothetical Protein YC6258_05456 [Gynuella sunshinyii YC6258]
MARIFQTNVMGEAHFRVAIVNHPGQADLTVYRVNSLGERRVSNHLTDSEILAETILF